MQSIHISSRVHPGFCLVGTRGSFVGVKHLWHESDNSPSSDVTIKVNGDCLGCPPYALMVFAGTTLPLYAILHFMTNKVGHVIALLINHHFICYRYIHIYVKLKDRKRSLSIWETATTRNFMLWLFLNNRNTLWHVTICRDAKVVSWLLKKMTTTISDFMKIPQVVVVVTFYSHDALWDKFQPADRSVRSV